MTRERERVLARLAEEIVAVRVPHRTRVGVDGVDAAGKTTLADELACVLQSLGRTVVRASTDSFHRPAKERYARGRRSPEGYYRDSFDYRSLRRYVFESHGSDDALLVLDGVFLARPQLADCWDYRIFVAIDEDESIRRGVARDALLLGGEDEARRLYEQRYVPGQRLYLAEAHPSERAQAVIDNTDPADPKLLQPSVRSGS
jgi:uridine kinase